MGSVARCGTVAGYNRHWRAGEERCQPCKDAMAAVQRMRKAGQDVPRELLGGTPRPIAPCGTRYGAARHRKRGEPLDEACRAAENAEARRKHAAKPRRAAPIEW